MVEPKPEQKKRFILWNEIAYLADHIASRIVLSGKVYNSIYGIARGGLIPAVVLSHRLNMPIVDATGINPGTLIVDDICDSGETLLEFKKGYQMIAKIEHLDVAVWYERTGTGYKANYVGEDISNNDWLVFPWEV